MGLYCACDETVLPAQIDVTCPQDLDQIVKIAFQKPQVTPPFTTLGGTIDLAASWTALTAAVDDTKIILSPALSNVIIPASEGTFIGENSNESLNGLGYYLGEQNVVITGEINSAPQVVIDELAKLSCFSDPSLGQTQLTIFPFLRRQVGVSRVLAKGTGVADEYKGFEIYNFRVSSLGNEGYNAKTKYMISFTMQPDEFKRMEAVALAFNPLSLVNV